MSKEAPSGATIFNKNYYLTSYEAISLPRGTAYMLSARIQSGLADLAGVTNPKWIAELGSGTGNPTSHFAKEFPDSQIVSIDPSRDALQIARYKFGQMPIKDWNEFTTDVSIPTKTKAGLTRRRKEAMRNMPNIHFVQAVAEGVPANVDLIMGVQFFHWPEDTSKALKSMRSALPADGFAIFDTSGLQMDWGDAEINGKKINELHPTGHPFHIRFLENLNSAFAQKGLEQIDPHKIDKFHRKFNMDQIEKLSEEAGFTNVPIDPNAFKALVRDTRATGLYPRIAPISGADFGKPAFNGVLIPFSKEKFRDFVLKGGKMRYFNSESTKNLPENEKQRLIDEAYQKALVEHAELLEEPVMENLAFFVLKAA